MNVTSLRLLTDPATLTQTPKIRSPIFHHYSTYIVHTYKQLGTKTFHIHCMGLFQVRVIDYSGAVGECAP